MNKNLYLFLGGVFLVAIIGLTVLSFEEEKPEHQFVSQTENVLPYAEQIQLERDQKDDSFQMNSQSPIPDTLKSKFKGLAYYPIDSAFKMQAFFNEQPGNALGELKFAGELIFTYQRKTQRLAAYWEKAENKKKLFIPFRDATIEKGETYGGGRFLEAEIGELGMTVLDFNRAYLPYCAYNPNYTCPIPPPENTLKFEVRAGEKLDSLFLNKH